jgi:hypothetical protein
MPTKSWHKKDRGLSCSIRRHTIINFFGIQKNIYKTDGSILDKANLEYFISNPQGEAPLDYFIGWMNDGAVYIIYPVYATLVYPIQKAKLTTPTYGNTTLEIDARWKAATNTHWSLRSLSHHHFLPIKWLNFFVSKNNLKGQTTLWLESNLVTLKV